MSTIIWILDIIFAQIRIFIYISIAVSVTQYFIYIIFSFFNRAVLDPIIFDYTAPIILHIFNLKYQQFSYYLRNNGIVLKHLLFC